MIEIKKKINFLELNLFKSTNLENWKNYYDFIENDNNIEIFKKIEENINYLNSKNYKIIKNKLLKFYNEDEIENFNFILSLIILKIFSINSIYSSKNDKLKSMYDYSNSISKEINKLLIWIEFKEKIDFKIEENEIWRFTIDFIALLIAKEIIDKEDFISNRLKKNKFIYIKNIIKDNNLLLARE